MQLIDTRVSANDDHTVTVVFSGEGNEEVSVRLSESSIQDEDAVLRAKAVMVQLTRFEEFSGEAVNRTPDMNETDATPVGGSARAGYNVMPLADKGSSSSSGRLFQNGDTDRDG